MISNKKREGYVIVGTLIFATIAVGILTVLAGWAANNFRAVRDAVDREKAFQIAEAGTEYYRWHLAHAPYDYYDGNASTTPGPYVHQYFDKEGNNIGRFELTITRPVIGATIVKIVSKGITASSSVSRTIETIITMPSLSRFAFVSHSAMRFGESTEIFGPVHANDGVRFDGLAHNLVTSAVQDYNDPDHHGNNEFGVHTHIQPPPSGGVSEGGLGSEAYNAVLTERNDVFMSGREFPVPLIDFNALTQDLSNLKTLGQANGYYFEGSGVLGYNIVLKTNDTFDLYKVNTLVTAAAACYKPNWDDQEGWGSWAIATQTFVRNYSLPANGIIFVEDNVWVEGKINTARVTIASGRFPEDVNTNTNISFNKDILYTNYDGRDVIALIAQNNINAGLTSLDTIEVDGALMAKNGRIGRYYYNASCSPYDERTKIKLYGMMASYKRYGFAYGVNQGGGYATKEIIYDANFLYSPPPSFPLMNEMYEMISWKEI